MINSLTIRNFKSIKSLNIQCKKLNVFIGEPNGGKSNIIEALSLQSQNALGQTLNKDIFRFKTVGDLFYDFNINEPIEILTNELQTVLYYALRENKAPENEFYFFLNKTKESKNPIKISHDGKINSHGHTETTKVHFYEFKRLSSFDFGYTPHLTVPFGDNLPALLLANSSYKKWVSEFLKSKNLTLTLKPTENDLAVSKFINDEIYSYPYFTISETLQRVIFYSIAIKSNNNSTLLFDEPESNTFPFYTKYLAERIALDQTNQFFLTTHNPYLLISLIEKSKLEDLNVGLVTMNNYQTEVKILTTEQIEKVLDFNSDVFFNFDLIVD